MKPRTAILSATVASLLLAYPPEPVQGQQQEAALDSLRARIDRLEARIDSLAVLLERARRAGRQEEAAEREDELAELRAAAQQAAGEAGPERKQEQAGGGSKTRNLQALNPEISITGDVVGAFTAPEAGPDDVSAVPREFEFSFQSALDPYTRTKIFVTHEEDFEIAGLEEPEGEGHGGGFEIEEGYLYWVGLPASVGVKLGKFRQEVGVYNRWHTHALLDVERPLATRAFLGEGGLIQTGLSLSPPSLATGAGTHSLTLELARGSNGRLFDGGNEISYLGHLDSFWELSSASYVELGATGVYGENDAAGLTSRLGSVDVTFRWTPPGRALYRDLRIAAEWYFAEKRFPGLERRGEGGYLQAHYRLDRSWIAGARADYVDGLGGEGEVWGVAPNVTWWQSEWVRLRLQYNYVHHVGGTDDHTLLLQTVWAMGPHKHENY